MKNYKIYLFLLLSFLSKAQENKVENHKDSTSIIIYKKHKPEAFMLWQVKSLSEFISRFNYQTYIDGKSMSDSIKTIFPRNIYLLKLFNEDDERLISKKKSNYAQSIKQFIELICETEAKISPKVTIQATLALHGTYLGKSTKLKMILEKSFNEKDSSVSWQVKHIQLPSDIFPKEGIKKNVNPDLKSDTLYKYKGLYPNAQDVAFVSLVQELDDNKSILHLISPQVPINKEITQLENALQSGDLTIQKTSDITLKLLVNSRYQIELQEFVREKENSGWLISNLIIH